MIRREENRNPFLTGASDVFRLSIASEGKGNRQMMALGKFCRVFNSQSPSILFWPTLMLLLTSMASTPGTALTATSQTGYIFSQPDQETHSTIRVWIMLDLCLGIKDKSLFSLFHFPFSLFGKKLPPCKHRPQRIKGYPIFGNCPPIKPTPANKCDHHNCHLILNINPLHKAEYRRRPTPLSSSALAHTPPH